MIRSEIEKLVNSFGLAAAFHGINKTNPLPKDPTDEILALITKSNQELLDRIERELPEKKPDWRGTKFREYHGFNDCFDQTKATIDRIKGEL